MRTGSWPEKSDARVEMIGLPAAGGIAKAESQDGRALAGSLDEPAIGRDHAIRLGRPDHAREPHADQAPIVQANVSSHGCDRIGSAAAGGRASVGGSR